MLLGTYEHTLDDKNRLTLPAKFREAFSNGIVVTRGMDGCVYAYTREDFGGLVERMRALDELSLEARMLQRHFFSGATDAELDRQGRVIIPTALLETGGLQREVVVAGVYNHVEIWDRAVWRTHLEEVEGSAEHVAERLAANRD